MLNTHPTNPLKAGIILSSWQSLQWPTHQRHLVKVCWPKLSTENGTRIIRFNNSDDFLDTAPWMVNGSVYQDFRKTLEQVHHTSIDTTGMNGLEMALLCGLVTAWKYTLRGWKLMTVNTCEVSRDLCSVPVGFFFDILSFTLMRKNVDYFCSRSCSKYGFRFTSIFNRNIIPCLIKLHNF